MDATQHGRIARGFHFEDLALGTTWSTQGRTLLESDLAAYVNLTWFTEDLFTDRHRREGNAIGGRPVPALLSWPSPKGSCCRPWTAPASPSSTSTWT